MKKLRIVAISIFAMALIYGGAAYATRKIAAQTFKAKSFRLIQAVYSQKVGEERKLIGTEIRLVDEKGRWKLIKHNLNNNRPDTVRNAIADGQYTDSEKFPPSVAIYEQSPGFMRKDKLLDYTACVIGKTEGTTTVELWYVPEVTGFPLKLVDKNPKMTLTVEPLSIEFIPVTLEMLAISK